MFHVMILHSPWYGMVEVVWMFRLWCQGGGGGGSWSVVSKRCEGGKRGGSVGGGGPVPSMTCAKWIVQILRGGV